jgi:cellulose synthase/poly-beta-1,6-N-acetylglucosamine synthase-like glycosyltransferase
VIVDNGSSDGTLERLRELATALAPGLDVVSEPRAGVSRGRNAGIRAARGEFIAMMDDDCLHESDFLDAVLQVFENRPIGYYDRRVLLHDPDDYPITIKTSLQREEFPSGTVLRRALCTGRTSASAERYSRGAWRSIRLWGRSPAAVRGLSSYSLPARRSGAGAVSTIRGRRCDTTMVGARPIPFVRWTAATTSGVAPITCVPRSSVAPEYWRSKLGTGTCGSDATAASGGSRARR